MSDVIADLTLVSARSIAERVTMSGAIAELQRLLRAGFDPEDDLPRSILDVPNGQLLLMPAAADGAVGQKFATVAPGNPSHGLERIQALYILLDGDTLAPTAILDGTALTSLRTPAVSASVVDLLAEPDAGDLVVFGTGPQAVRHVEALQAIRPLRTVRLIGRDQDRTRQAVEAARAIAPDAQIMAGTPEDVRTADLIVCATTASEPLFAASDARDDATIVAIGSHEPTKAEIHPDLVGRSQVVVESRRVALAEAGDVIRAIGTGSLQETDLVTMHELFTGAVAPATARPRIVKTCGMGWQDLAVARLVI
ncbi:ornithine cyclodeaminase/alanine dehydrogenase-like protein (mu-crystallin family) [Microbacterium sp. W4I4]|uniref:ornithine cyclodeaminase family protein n=1 Tax=Microbacterium sp. W4I4 TaxID=3042295 RepID=UPI002782A299|nr:ornithine cyclodeaminase family protein [Microbacterium sp. W4I4]MDQ0615286.1 ornithine cyclodeaminase/alanine dehydrogenase-like protein (mu-crystallin family) [Microbacterium sp. W4I4]